ncbi:hypothetical protein [Polaromonas sp. OV174]|uniref:hypothetical protein n=1 Tax=Polaromonas sp. OV174 TaxID=1855300 RepID=UPI0011609922|nr:hypothetical protein [Polaromonas sp. OV174]
MKHEIPSDYPGNPYPSGMGGAQPKFVARKIGDRFVVGLTEEERQERYAICLDLMQQLVPYGQRKREENPMWSTSQILRRIHDGVLSLETGLTHPEIVWLVSSVARKLDWPPEWI